MKEELIKTKDILKKSKISLAKSTTALTCLVGALIISSESGLAATTTGSMVVSTSVASTCTVSAASMSFAAYTASTITATSVITANCTNGTAYTISFNDSPDGATASTYKLVRSGGLIGTASDTIEVSFTNGASTMTNAAATITGTGTGSSAAAGTITGSIAGSQTGKTAGTFSKTMTLNIVY